MLSMLDSSNLNKVGMKENTAMLKQAIFYL